MKKLTALALLSGVFGMNPTHAMEGQLNFLGRIVDQTCFIDTESKNLQVNMPSVNSNQLSQAGQTAGETPFSITIRDCFNGTVQFHLASDGNGIDQETGNIMNRANSPNLQVQLLNAMDQPIALNKPVGEQNIPEERFAGILNNNGQRDVNFKARYYAKAPVAAGAFIGRIRYNITYR